METWIKTGIGFFFMLFGAEIVVRQEMKRSASNAVRSVDSGDDSLLSGRSNFVPDQNRTNGE